MTTRLRRALAATVIPSTALVLAGCVAPQELGDPPEREDVLSVDFGDHTPQDGGELVMALSSEPDRLDPTTSTSLYTRYVMQTMCEKLYDVDAEGQVVPMLASGMPEISDDGLTVEIPLRTDGVRFADGTAFDAEAVVTTLDRNVNHEDSMRASELGPITDIEAVDDDTVRVTFERPFAPFTAALADRAGMMLSPKALEELGDDFGDSPVCIGAFRFEKRVPQTSISVVADPNYYDRDGVHLDRIEYRIMTDANIRAANIRSGDVHIADNISPQDIDAIQQESGIGTLQVPSLGYQGLTINLNRLPDGMEPTPLSQQEEIRRALSVAVDREALVNTVFNGWYLPACSGISDTSPFASEASRSCPEYDPEGARKILEEAGVEVPYPLHVQVTNTQDSLRYAQALQAQLAESGFAVSVTPVEYTAILDTQDRGDFEVIQLGWSGRVDPHGNLYSFLYTGGGNNYTGIDDADLNERLDEAASLTDPAERAQAYGRVVERAHETNSIIYLYRQRYLTAHTEDLAGVQVYADGVVRLSHAGFIAEEEGR
ncbi:ABC transporter substrate-binding protein [Ornithinimicrobium cavernae]|uniref:ABC transporter substrate-binding protein n=1 Tax=Ornithinimicrobium cavernae TaxID=2666047 RepID=UPI000D69AF54|nr:ABC transporter substrate-binding protein [Ornithinimicrobium cavernae]